MKSRLIHLMKISCLMMIVIPVQLCIAQSAERSLWVWSNTDAIINDFIESDTIATDWEDFISFCEAPHGDPSDRISTVYMSAFNYMQFYPDKMRTFLADMSSRNFKVFVVLADPEFALPQANQTEREDFKNMIADIIAFEKKGSPNERFAGIMLDIEPHQNSGPNATLNFYTPEHFKIIWETYKTSLANCQKAVKAYNDSYDPDITWSDAVPFWFSDVTDRDDNGIPEILMNEIIEIENDGFYTVMAYRDSASEIIDVAYQEIAAAGSAGKQCVIGVETMDLAEKDNGQTFWEEGTTALETALDSLNTEYGNNDGFGGFAIHMYANANNDEEAYQHLHTEEATDHAPVINITSPNGVEVDGISYPDDFEIFWTASIPDTSKTCTVEVSYKFEEDPDNDSDSWHIIDTDSNISPSVTQSSCTFDTTGIATSQSNRIIIRAQISYTSVASLTTEDRTNYGIAINEAPSTDTDIWGDNIHTNFPGYPQNMQIIADNDNNLHATYYRTYSIDDSNPPGVYYAKSTNNGSSWSTIKLSPEFFYDTHNRMELEEDNDDFNQLSDWAIYGFQHLHTVYWKLTWNANIGTVEIYKKGEIYQLVASGTGSENSVITLNEENASGITGSVDIASNSGNDDYITDNTLNIKSSWPHKPSFAKRGNLIAVAWIADTQSTTNGNGVDRSIQLQINTNNGNPANWLSQRIMVTATLPTMESPQYPNVNIHIDDSNGIHIVWETYQDNLSSINYAKYSYNSSSEAWEEDVSEPIAQSTSDYSVRTPSITTTSHGVHAIWGEYKKLTIEATPGATIFEEPFNDYAASEWAAYGAQGGVSTLTGFIRLLKTSDPEPTLRCGLYQKSAWNPTKNLSNSTISIDIRTNLSSGIPLAVTAEIYQTRLDRPQTDFSFSLPPSEFKTLPASSAGWQTLVFNVNDLDYNMEGVWWATPRLDDIKMVKIRIEYTGNAEIDIDNFVAVGAGEVTVLNPEMRIVGSTKTTSWGTEEQIFPASGVYEYDNEQVLPNAIAKHVNFPVYFPKITSMGDYAYATWQVTTVGKPDNDSLAQYSSVYFSKRDVSSTSNSWDTPQTLSSNGYAPAISVWNNSGTPTVQVVYSNNFEEYIPDDAYTGDLLYIESIDQGANWSNAIYLAQGSGTASGIRSPYTNHTGFGTRAFHHLSYPFIYSDNNGISTINWINGGQNGSGNTTGVPEEFYKIRGLLSLNPPNPPFVDFVDLTEDNNRILTWDVPNTSFAPTAYKVTRIADNDESNAQELNNGDPIYALNFIDNDSMTPDVHYRYQIRYLVNTTPSGWSTSSNAIKDDIYLLIDDFELDTTDATYTGNQYSTSGTISETITDSTSYSGTNSYKVVYTGGKGYVTIEFPTVMDFSNYGSLDLQIKFNPEPEKIERLVRIKLVDASSNENFEIGASVMLRNDGQWHLCHQFLDQITPDTRGATLDLSKISALKFVIWESNISGEAGPTSFFVDDIKLNNNPILLIDQEYLTMSEPISHRGMEQGFVINQPQTPVQVLYGNGKIPWYLRIYTNSEILDNDGETHDILKDGLIRYDNESDNDTYYPDLNLPIKVWCKNFGPVGFFDKDTNEIDNDDYSVNGYPPITNRYFFRGYDFNKNKDIFGLLPEGDNQFIESKTPGAGNYPFDLDGDGFMEGDNFFTESARAVIGEEPVWLTIPVKKHPTREMDSDAIVMDPDNDATWRLITDYVKGSEDNHIVELYFAVFMGTDQIMNTKDEHAYGLYRGKIIIDMLFN